MPFTDYDDVVEAFASNRANDPLGIGVLPRRPRRNYHLPNVQCLRRRLHFRPAQNTPANTGSDSNIGPLIRNAIVPNFVAKAIEFRGGAAKLVGVARPYFAPDIRPIRVIAGVI